MSTHTDQIPKISLRGVCKSFGDKRVLDNVDLDVMNGDSVVVIGGSGTGKSVMLKCILGLMEPDSGSIKIDGVETVNMPNRDRETLLRRVGMLFQGGALFDSLPVWENVSFSLMSAHKARRAEAYDIAVDILAKVGLEAPVADMSPSALSGGMQKRVGLARAIASSPEIIFFDEPTTGLDPITADVINRLIVERVQDLGATTLTITHDMSSVRKIANRVSMLHGGKIIWTGPVDQIDNSGNPYLEQFINGLADGPIQTDLGGAL
jgi:phospholipid/cholesterol/gamma-HCH transport system ATP-binding protein